MTVVLTGFLVLLLTAPRAGARGRVVVDLHRQAPWLLTDTGALGHSELRRELTNLGLRVVGETRPLDRVAPALDAGDLLFLSVSKFGRYASTEIEAVDQLVRRGGRVVVFGEHDDVYRVSSGLQNPLLAPHGLRFAHDSILVDGADWITVDARALGVLGARFYCSPTLVAEGPGTVILSDRLPLIGERLHPSGGRLVAVADSEFTLNGEYTKGRAARFGLRDGFNRAMILSVVRRLLADGTGVLPAFTTPPPPFFTARGTAAVHVYAGPNGGAADGESDGFGDLLAHLSARGVPLRPADDLDRIPDGAPLLLLHPLGGPPTGARDRFGRVAVIGDAWSEIDDYTDNGMLLRDAGIADPPPPFFARFLAARGIRFPPGQMLDLDRFREEEAALFAPLPGGTGEAALKRAGLILARGTLEVLAPFAASSFWNPVSLGLDERVPWSRTMERCFYDRRDERPENVGRAKWEANLAIPTRPSSDLPPGRPALLVRAGETLALADADAVTNRFLADFPGNVALADALADFFLR